MGGIPMQDSDQISNTATPNVGPAKKPLFNQPKMVVKMASASKPSMFAGSKAGGLFKKPALGAKKKF